MSERLLLSMPAPSEPTVQWLQWDTEAEQMLDSGVVDAQASALATLAERFASLPCFVVVPGEWVSWQRVVLPKGGRVGLSALPFLLEEQLCSDLEQVHLACGVIRANESTDVLVVDRQYMDRWHGLLANSGLKIKTVVPDYAALPANVALIDDTRAVAHIGQQAIAIAKDNLSYWWQLAAGQDTSAQIYHLQGTELPAGLNEQGQQVFEHRLAMIAKLWQPWPVNLFSGAYALRDESAAQWKQFRWPVLLLLTVLFTHFIQLALDVRDNRRQIELYEQGMVDIYRDVFPGARVVNARSQMRSQLNALEGVRSDSDFLPWLERIANASKGNVSLRIQQMTYANSAIKILVEADSYDGVDRWVAALASQGFEVERGAFGQMDKGISGQLELREAAQ
ncbi:type II secretion system protein GspL [Spongiibacter marinus]|uniref:type II secretion system protein GspL n=1 Tax=Spongiibacter marinus TaxID=354246 RepID=UPI0012B5A3E0|nr:type II secretion system protein GspL [Spongiibacter marinus]